MAIPASGIATFLFTDVEGSTRLLRELGATDYARALAAHRRVLRTAFRSQRGMEIDTQGDAFFYVFRSPSEAVAAAAAGVRALGDGRIRVRIGVHTGRYRLTSEGYVGEDVHLAARIAAAGCGGQVLLSKATRDAIDDTTDEEILDLGEHRLKDFPEPVWIYQLGRERFPSLRTITNTNLPRPASSFVGRERDLDEIMALLRNGCRLLTLTGAGGSGKTRLAIAAAGQLVTDRRNGTFWIPLAAVGDPALVVEAISRTIGAREPLADYIAEREMMLVLDNFEQVAGAGPQIASLVEACPNVSVLVTSREVLRVRGEIEYPVPPLTDRDAVELFSTRSGLQPDEAIAELCRQLDNLPLAVELAAARTRVLTPIQLLDRISERLDLLKSGRDAEARQRTLRATIAWSHDLLEERDQRLFAQLSIFVGGWTLEAAQRVCGADLDTLESLAEKSLVRHRAGRFTMLETIRDYASERLHASGDAEELSLAHADWVLAMVNDSEVRLHGADQNEWLDRLDTEAGNLRAALSWALASGNGELGGRIAASSFWFWQLRSHLGEGERWLRQAVARSSGWPPDLRARLLHGHGQLTYYRGASVATSVPLAERGAAAEAAHVLEEAVRACREAGLRGALAQSLAYLSIAAGESGEPDRCQEAGEEAIRVARAIGDDWTIGLALWAMGTNMVQGVSRDTDPERAAAILDESVARLRPTGDRWALSAPLFYLGVLARRQGDLPRAFELATGAADAIRATGDKYRLASGARYIADLAEELGEIEAARRYREEADLVDDELGRRRSG